MLFRSATVSPHVRSWSERVTVDGEEVELGPGDSAHYRTTHPHSWCNPSAERPAIALWLVVRGT